MCALHYDLQYEETALHLAADGGHLKMIKFLVLQCGQRVDEENSIRHTCRDIAVEGGHQHVVDYLDSDFPDLKRVSATLSTICNLVGYMLNNWPYLG